MAFQFSITLEIFTFYIFRGRSFIEEQLQSSKEETRQVLDIWLSMTQTLRKVSTHLSPFHTGKHIFSSMEHMAKVKCLLHHCN